MASHGASVEPAYRRKQIPHLTSKTTAITRLPKTQGVQARNEALRKAPSETSSTTWAKTSVFTGQNVSAGTATTSKATEPNAHNTSTFIYDRPGIVGVESQMLRKPVPSAASSLSQISIPSMLSIPQPPPSRTNTLRRKPSLISTYVSQARSVGLAQSAILEYGEAAPSTSLLSIPKQSMSASSSVTEFEDGYSTDTSNFAAVSREASSVDPIPQSMSAPPPSVTPSTRYSESPGAFSHVTTPTSMSSYSSRLTSSPGTKSTVFGMSPGHASHVAKAINIPNGNQYRTYPPFDRHQGPKGGDGVFYTATRTQSPVQMTNLPRQTIPRSAPSTYPVSKLKIAENTSSLNLTAKAPPSKLKNPLVFPPPELAHLMESPSRAQISLENAPRRPSREGTSSLLEEQRTSPVIHSKLPPLRSPFVDHKRRDSVDQDSDAGSATSASPRKLQTLPSPNAHVLKPEPTPVPRSALRKPKPLNPDSQNKSGPRFGFFTRKPKPEARTSDNDSTKPTKKGPMAGTGHEGYGKYAARRRSAGLAIAAASTTQSSLCGDADMPDGNRKSVSSNRSQSDMNDDAYQALGPTMTDGKGSASDAYLASCKQAGSASSQNTFDSLSPVGSSIGSPKTFRTSDSSTDTHGQNSVMSMLPSFNNFGAFPRSPSVENSDSDASNTASRIPARKGFFSSRSLGKSNAHKGVSTLPLVDKSSSQTNLVNQEQPSDLRKAITQANDQPISNSKKNNWSLFSKSRQTPKTRHIGNVSKEDITQEMTAVEQVPVAVEPDLSARSIAHYAIPESHDQISIADLNDILQEAEASQEEEELEYSNKTTMALPQDFPVVNESSEVVSAAPFMSSASLVASNVNEPPYISQSPADSGFAESKELHSSVALDETTPRPSRLLQVGRIPKVVSKRDRIRTLPDRSFSRPFAKTQPMPSLSKAKPPSTRWPNQSEAKLRTAPVSTDPQILKVDTLLEPVNAPDTASNPTSNSTEEEFLSFPVRKNSDLSYSSSSGTMHFPSSIGMASDTGTPLSEDEVWQEYDDLLDDILTPSSSNTIVQIKTRGDFPTPPNVRLQSISDTRGPTENSKSALPSSNSLRRSRLLAILQPESPSSTSFFPLVLDGEDPLNDVVSKRRSSLPKSILASIHTARSSQSSDLRASMIARNFNNVNTVDMNNKLSSPVDKGRSRPESSANLRFGALMVSKWLSFGRVLFSPAHFEMITVSSERILVVDGLGKDWSYWCALTYSNSEIYNLGPPPAENSSKREIGGFKSLPNHQYISHSSPAASFPFPKGFFATVVYRFPVISTEAGYRYMISECKRVLRPGGFLEISMLDLDLNGMGNRARRAVRQVKTKLQELDPDVCLQPPDDIIIRLLGHRGFENLNRCVVGLPAAGVVSDSRENSIDKGKKNLADLVKDESKEGDDNITKMVAKVGRWWYTRSFEKSLLPSREYSGSIWNDNALLKECETMETSLKLLICYAQKPSINKRRTVSL